MILWLGWRKVITKRRWTEKRKHSTRYSTVHVSLGGHVSVAVLAGQSICQLHLLVKVVAHVGHCLVLVKSSLLLYKYMYMYVLYFAR